MYITVLLITNKITAELYNFITLLNWKLFAHWTTTHLFLLPLATTILQYFSFCDLEDNMKKEAQGRFGSYWASDGEKVLKVKI